MLRTPGELGHPEFRPEERAAAGDVAERHRVAAQVLLLREIERERGDPRVDLPQLARDPSAVTQRRIALALEERRDAGVRDAVAQRLVTLHARALDSRRGNEA